MRTPTGPSRLLALSLLLTGDAFSSAVPCPQSLGTDVSILTHNDLYGNATTRQAATLVLSAPVKNRDAKSHCEALHESLWTPANAKELDFLRYLDYDGSGYKTVGKAAQYWIGGHDSSCQAITSSGKISTVACDKKLPALCSQSATLINDNSARWQTSVNTGGASIQGYRDRNSFRFLGIKYASIPSRFSYSAYEAPRGQVSALAYGPGCIQAECRLGKCSEDCLYLNIWTPTLPSGPKSPKKAVMFWVHGGSFTSGFGSDPSFDGGNMASRGDVVVVTINYRLSSLGHLALDDKTHRGNYWLSDQVAAVDWVHKHIADFGGDNKRVTVFGQSAGAASVRALVASPLTKGKLSRAIFQSNPGGLTGADSYSKYQSVAAALNKTKVIVSEKGCAKGDAAAQLACLRALDASVLVNGTVAASPIQDGKYLNTPELLLDGTGPKLDVALMNGMLRDDGNPFSAFSTTTNVSQAVAQQGYDASAILGSGLFPYPQTSNATLDIFNLTSRLATDGFFRCATQSTTYAAVTNKVFPVVYGYEFDRSFQVASWDPNPPTCQAPPSAERPLGDTRLPYYKCHSGEIHYVFGTAQLQGRQPRDQQDVPFSQFIIDSWTAFGRTRNPNPEPGFLRARGFANTTATLEKAGKWSAMDKSFKNLRILDVQPKDEGFRELKQCEVLKLPLDDLTR